MKEGLVKLYNEINNYLLNSEKPSKELSQTAELDLFKEYPFYMIYQMALTPQSKKHHPEGNVWKHTLMVVDEGAKVKSKSRDERAFMWSLLLHDIGKPDTTKVRKGRITSYDHDKAGEKLAREFLEFFNEDEEFINLVSNYVYFHMHPLFILKGLPFADVEKMKNSIDINELALLSFCDRSGRLGADKVEEEKLTKEFLDKVQR